MIENTNLIEEEAKRIDEKHDFSGYSDRELLEEILKTLLLLLRLLTK